MRGQLALPWIDADGSETTWVRPAHFSDAPMVGIIIIDDAAKAAGLPGFTITRARQAGRSLIVSLAPLDARGLTSRQRSATTNALQDAGWVPRADVQPVQDHSNLR